MPAAMSCTDRNVSFPYAMSDHATTFAAQSLGEMLTAMEKSGPHHPIRVMGLRPIR